MKLQIELDDEVITAVNEYYEGKREAVGIDNGYKILEAIHRGVAILGINKKIINFNKEKSFMDFNNFMEGLTNNLYQKLKEQEEKDAIQEFKDSHKIESIVLIANPKHKDFIADLKASGIDVSVAFSPCVEENKIYQVMEPELRQNIIEMDKERADCDR